MSSIQSAAALVSLIMTISVPSFSLAEPSSKATPSDSAGSILVGPDGVLKVVRPASEPPRQVIGVGLSNLQAGVHKLLGIDAGTGLLVNKVMPDLPAAQAGVEPFDLILKINGQPALSPEQLIQASADSQETPIKLTLRRGHTELELEVTPTLAKPPEGAGAPERQPPSARMIQLPQGLEFDVVGPGLLRSRPPGNSSLRTELDEIKKQQADLAEKVQRILDVLEQRPSSQASTPSE